MRDIFKQFDIELSDQQENKLKEYYKILVMWQILMFGLIVLERSIPLT